jgi:hypothetical protein
MIRRLNWKAAVLVAVAAAGLATLPRALAIGTVIADPTLCPVYVAPTAPPSFIYPGTCTNYTYWIPDGDGGYIQIPQPPGAKPPTPAPDADPATKPSPFPPAG